jgi:hypothetical protein
MYSLQDLEVYIRTWARPSKAYLAQHASFQRSRLLRGGKKRDRTFRPILASPWPILLKESLYTARVVLVHQKTRQFPTVSGPKTDKRSKKMKRRLVESLSLFYPQLNGRKRRGHRWPVKRGTTVYRKDNLLRFYEVQGRPRRLKGNTLSP